MGEKQLWKLIYCTKLGKANSPHGQIAKSQCTE